MLQSGGPAGHYLLLHAAHPLLEAMELLLLVADHSVALRQLLGQMGLSGRTLERSALVLGQQNQCMITFVDQIISLSDCVLKDFHELVTLEVLQIPERDALALLAVPVRLHWVFQKPSGQDFTLYLMRTRLSSSANLTLVIIIIKQLT